MNTPSSQHLLTHRLVAPRALGIHHKAVKRRARQYIRALRPTHVRIFLHPGVVMSLLLTGVLMCGWTMTATAAPHASFASTHVQAIPGDILGHVLTSARAWLWLAWPAYTVCILMMVSFWLGERHQVAQLLAKRLIEPTTRKQP